MADKEHLIIFDTTLRDGEQSPGASMTLEEKLMIAKALEHLKVDIIEAGFPAASPGDFEAVKNIANVIKGSVVCGLARALGGDVDKAGEAIKSAERGRVHTFIASSPIHMAQKLKMTEDEVLDKAVKAIHRAQQYTDDVEFSPEDAGRSELDFLCRLIEAAINAGAKTINIADTVGYTLPYQFGELFTQLKTKIPNSDKAIFSTHCHNDLGLAVANSLAAVKAGARQVECTINGLGERAGNASLEEIVMAVRVRQDEFACNTRLDTKEILNCSRLVSTITGFPVQPNKAIVGANAFAHESGIHQDGVLKHRETYEIMQAEDIGWHNNRMVLGKHSGRNAFKSRLNDLGLTLETDEAVNLAFEKFKRLADKKHEIFDEDLMALVSDRISVDETVLQLRDIKLDAQTGREPHATVLLTFRGEEKVATETGDGVVDAIFKAIESIVQSDAQLLSFSINAVTEGTDSLGGATVRLEKDGRIVNSRGADTDIVFASAKAYVNGLNQLLFAADKIHPQTTGM